MPGIEISTITVDLNGTPTTLAIKGSGGGSTNAREISWAEYQQLTTAQKTNGTIYFVPDYVPS